MGGQVRPSARPVQFRHHDRNWRSGTQGRGRGLHVLPARRVSGRRWDRLRPQDQPRYYRRRDAARTVEAASDAGADRRGDGARQSVQAARGTDAELGSAMLSLRTHAIIFGALLALIIGIASIGNALEAAGTLPPSPTLQLIMRIVFFGLVIALALSAVPVMVKSVI